MVRAPAEAKDSPRLALPDITVVAVDCLHPQLAARALEICLAQCSFGDAVLFTDAPVSGAFRTEQIAPLHSLDDYSRFCLQEMPGRTIGEFVLVVQWDGYVVDTSAWSPAFLRHDYIGAPYLPPGEQRWVVGNGGFSLRSRRLLAALPSLPVIAGVNEDRLISQTFRETLERDHGVRFAPDRVADRFSFEQRPAGAQRFGFHGAFNLGRAVRDDGELLRIISALSPVELSDGRVVQLIQQCLADGRTGVAGALYRVVRQATTPATLRAALYRSSGSAEVANRALDQLEALLGASPPET